MICDTIIDITFLNYYFSERGWQFYFFIKRPEIYIRYWVPIGTTSQVIMRLLANKSNLMTYRNE